VLEEVGVKAEIRQFEDFLEPEGHLLSCHIYQDFV
jgi:hypothetical protein